MLAVIKIEDIRQELIDLVEEAGSDYRASELLKPFCSGYAPDRSTIGKFRRGEGKPTLIAMTVTLLRAAMHKKIRIDRVGESPYYIDIELCQLEKQGMHKVSKEIFDIALGYRGLMASSINENIEQAFEEGSFEIVEDQLSAYMADSGIVFDQQPDIESYTYFISEEQAKVVALATMYGNRNQDRMVTHHDANPKVQIALNVFFPEDEAGEIELEFDREEY